MHLRISAAIAVCAVALLAVPAQADGWRIALPFTDDPQDFRGSAYRFNPLYLDPEGGYQWRSLPDFRFGGVRPVFETDVPTDGWIAGLTLGWRLPPGWAPWLGQHPRLEVSGSGFELFYKTDANNNGVEVDWVHVAPVAGQAFNYAPEFAQFKARVEGWEVALRLAADWRIAPAFTVTGAIAVFGGENFTRYNLVNFDASGANFFNDVVHERIRTSEIGGTFSLAGRWMVMPALSLTVGGGVSVLHMRARLNAFSCFDDTALVPGCQPPDVAATEDSLSRIGYRLIGQAGVGYDFGFAKVDVFGGVRYNSVVPEINNPTAAGQTATLSTEGRLGYFVALRASIPLYPWF